MFYINKHKTNSNVDVSKIYDQCLILLEVRRVWGYQRGSHNP